jgi:putative hydrolase of the HAD superfamily
VSRFDVIAFDADDTLWHNERLYLRAQDKFRTLLSQYHSPEWIDERLYQAEMRNLPHFGYGIKSFALSMIETAVELTEGRITGRDLRVILDAAKEMLVAEVELIDDVRETLAQLASRYDLMVITKGDLHDQESKLARSRLGEHFRRVEIVSSKSAASYAALLKRHGIAAKQFLMVGNSLRSDILPVLEIGGSAVYIPYELTWAHEMVDPPPAGQAGFYEIQRVGLLPGLLEAIERDGQS